MERIFPQWLRHEYRLTKIQGRLIQLSTWKISPLELSNRVLSMENRCSCFLVWIDSLFYLLVAWVEDNTWNFNTWKISTVSLSVWVVNLPLAFADVCVFFYFCLWEPKGWAASDRGGWNSAQRHSSQPEGNCLKSLHSLVQLSNGNDFWRRLRHKLRRDQAMRQCHHFSPLGPWHHAQKITGT